MAKNGHNTKKHNLQESKNRREIKITPIEDFHFESRGSEEEAQKWIDEFSKFEDMIEIAQRIPLREFVGSPLVRPLADIIPTEIELELERILEILADHNIYVEFLYLDDVTEAYRFIVEELLDELIEDVPLCMNCHYIYEDFHPNDVEDAKMWAKDFLWGLYHHDKKIINVINSSSQLGECPPDATPVSEIFNVMEHLHTSSASYKFVGAKSVTSLVQGDQAVVEMTVIWRQASSNLTDASPSFGKATLYLERSEYGGWDVTHYTLPNLF